MNSEVILFGGIAVLFVSGIFCVAMSVQNALITNKFQAAKERREEAQPLIQQSVSGLTKVDGRNP